MPDALDYEPGPSESQRQLAVRRRRAEWREALVPLVVAFITVVIVLICFMMLPRP